MPATGREDSKYVKKIHAARYPSSIHPGRWATSCGKLIKMEYVTLTPELVTCGTCRRVLRIQGRL